MAQGAQAPRRRARLHPARAFDVGDRRLTTAGLRELKKARTRELIASTAARLFGEHGFDAVTIDDVARAAEVSRQTVFNYFPSKEAMLFDRDAEQQEALVAVVRDRPPGSSLVEAFRRHTHAIWAQLEARLADGPVPHGFWAIVRSTPALQNYAVAMGARHAGAVAAELARERGAPPGDPVCLAVAQALCGVHSAVFAYGLDRIVDGDPPEGVVADALERADAAYDLLAHGVDSEPATWARAPSA